MIIVQTCRNNMSLIFSMFKTSCFVVSRKSCNMFIFSYIIMHEYSGVTVSILDFHADGQGSSLKREKFFHEIMEYIFIKLCPAKVVLCLFSAISTYMITVVSILAFQAGDQGSKPTRTYFFLLNGHIFLNFIISFSKFYS